jgi:hypothetical protein
MANSEIAPALQAIGFEPDEEDVREGEAPAEPEQP